MLSRHERLASAGRGFTVILIGLFALARAVSAATLAGSVTDPNGRSVAGARIVVTTTLGAVASSITDQRGAYEIGDLPAGSYDVSVIADGFQADPAHVQLGQEDRRELTLQLRVSAVSESIVVTAAQIDVPLTRTGAAVSVITEADLRAGQITTVPEALRSLPGLTVVGSGGRGAITSVFPRGGGSNYTLVLVDGIRANSFGGGYDFGHLATTAVERIEVARGAQSAIFGSDALGGVVQVITKRDGPPRAGGLIEGGSQGTFRAIADTAGSNGAWSWGGGVERAVSDGFTGTAANGGTVSNDDDMLARMTGSLGWRKPGGADVLVSANYGHDERGPGPFWQRSRRLYPASIGYLAYERYSQIGGRTALVTPAIRQRIEANSWTCRASSRARRSIDERCRRSDASAGRLRGVATAGASAGSSSFRARHEHLRHRSAGQRFLNEASSAFIRPVRAAGAVVPDRRTAIRSSVPSRSRSRSVRISAAACISRTGRELGQSEGRGDLSADPAHPIEIFHTPSGERRNGHPAAERVRSCVHRQPGLAAGTQPEL